MKVKINYILSLILFFTISSCTKDISEYGKITPYDSSDNQTFIFSVTDEYSKSHNDSSKDIDHPKMLQSEADLLRQLLHRQNMCINEYNNPSFAITSQQEKIYDVTFASLIQENYNARAAVPKRYYGRCVAVDYY